MAERNLRVTTASGRIGDSPMLGDDSAAAPEPLTSGDGSSGGQDAPARQWPLPLRDLIRTQRVRALADAAYRDQAEQGVATEILLLPTAEVYEALGVEPPVTEQPATELPTGDAGSDESGPGEGGVPGGSV
jgi:hypothetical protein